MNRTTLLASTALSQGRVVQTLLHDRVLPSLPPSQRTFAERLVRQISRGNIFDDSFLDELEAFVASISLLIADGTVVGWEADEHDVRGGHEVVHLDGRAEALSPVVNELQSLWTAIAETLDAAKASVVAAGLVSE